MAAENRSSRPPGHLRRRIAAVVVGVVFALGSTQLALARDAFVLISGGDTPFENNYSQYLQARAVAAVFQRLYPPESVWIFFGAGNVEGERVVFGDVRRQVRSGDRMLDTWLPGTLKRNRPARREDILRAFREEILPSMADGGTLFLFVGDHGSRTEGDDGESTISLWSLHRDGTSKRGWRSTEDETLGVTELRDLLSQGIGRGRVVFCMTQCHAGGFHYLAGPGTTAANPKWFRVLPGWVNSGMKSAVVAAAGFTATDEFSPAAGCDPAPNPDDWTGYERYFPEQLFGLDLFTLEPSRRPQCSFADAHAAATLVDETIDKPYSTSEHFLERWATLIESRLADEPALTRRANRAVAAYHRAVDGDLPRLSDRMFRARQARFNTFIETLARQNPSVRDLVLSGTRGDLEDVIDPEREQPNDVQPESRQQPEPAPPPQRPGRRRGGRGGAEVRRLWNETLRPAWTAAVEGEQVLKMLGAAREFEARLLELEANGGDFFSGGPRSTLPEEAFWHSGYSNPDTLDPVKAEAVIRWGVDRRPRILEWARSHGEQSVRDAGERISRLRPQRTPPPQSNATSRSSPEPISRETAAARTLFYRRVLAAWAFLLTMKESPALDRLAELIELEHTPLPAPHPGNDGAAPSAARPSR